MLNWFTRHRQPNRIATKLYGSIVALSRQPELYRACNISDTVEARFEVLAAHMFLFLELLRLDSEERGDIAQELVDMFFADMDTTQRELGVGDLTVPKKMRKIAVLFDERMDRYQAAFDEATSGALEKILEATVFSGQTNQASVKKFSRYMHHILKVFENRSIQMLGQKDKVTSHAAAFFERNKIREIPT